jgi:hypothetical protein
MLRHFLVYFQWPSIAIGDSMQHGRNMIDDPNDNARSAPRRSVHRYLPDDDPNFSIRDPEPSDPDDDPFANDPEARRRPTRKEVRYDLIRRMYRAYMAPHPRVPEFRQTTTEAVRQIIEGYQDHFGIEISESTVYRALGLRRPKKKRSRHNS